MMDQHFDRQYQIGRAHLNDGIDRLSRRLARKIGTTFETFHRIQFSAPWTNPRPR